MAPTAPHATSPRVSASAVRVLEVCDVTDASQDFGTSEGWLRTAQLAAWVSGGCWNGVLPVNPSGVM